MPMLADYVIVGAGSAGCVLANRLTEDANARVVLIEASGRDWNPLIHIPAGYMKLLDHPTLTWGFHAESDPGTAGRTIAYPRGRVLGGSSSINGMIYVRGQPEDFDYWAQLGNRGWSWDDYDDLSARWALDDTTLHELQEHGLLYDRDESGEFRHLYTDAFHDRFFFEPCSARPDTPASAPPTRRSGPPHRRGKAQVRHTCCDQEA
jgi:hypothetical protein